MKLHTQDNITVIPQGSDLDAVDLDANGDYESKYPGEFFLIHLTEEAAVSLTTARGTTGIFTLSAGTDPIILVSKVWDVGTTARQFTAIY